MKDNNFPQLPPGGIRALLASLNEEEKLNEHPVFKEGWKEGWDDGYKTAQDNHKRLAGALAKVYGIDR